MKKLSKRAWGLFLGIAFILPAMAYGALYWYNYRIADMPYFRENYSLQTSPPYYAIPDFSFVNQDSILIDNSFIKNKIWVAHYFFTTCTTICPKMMNGMNVVQKAFPDNEYVRFVSFTVDPEHDTPAILKQYAQSRGIQSKQWQLLTGDKKKLYQYARKGLFIVATDGDGGEGDFIHSEKLVLIDNSGHIRGYYDGTENNDIQLLINNIKRLLAE
ncbi:SCO family protein [Chitinophaga oryziterrae]|uniref:SCO family protein n=1 Tax=Chitinophaga oryziterrae TaxID=1031224 RepID=A0A6N8JGR8_9BACT|nr:SCO family protein [Chitinophaga oryziterrae]MVT43549.1 SCO family protein [Chitinophaga oryziterrae]